MKDKMEVTLCALASYLWRQSENTKEVTNDYSLDIQN